MVKERLKIGNVERRILLSYIPAFKRIRKKLKQNKKYFKPQKADIKFLSEADLKYNKNPKNQKRKIEIRNKLIEDFSFSRFLKQLVGDGYVKKTKIKSLYNALNLLETKKFIFIEKEKNQFKDIYYLANGLNYYFANN